MKTSRKLFYGQFINFSRNSTQNRNQLAPEQKNPADRMICGV